MRSERLVCGSGARSRATDAGAGGWKNALIEVERPLRLGSVGSILGVLQQLVELALQNFLVTLVILEGLVERLGTPGLLALQLLHRGAEVLNRPRLLMLFVADHRLERGVDMQRRLAAGTSDFD